MTTAIIDTSKGSVGVYGPPEDRTAVFPTRDGRWVVAALPSLRIIKVFPPDQQWRARQYNVALHGERL